MADDSSSSTAANDELLAELREMRKLHEAKQDATPGVPPGFMEKALDSMPRFVMGLVGSFLGIAISGVIILKMGGLDGVVLRMANAYAAGFEVQMNQIARDTGKLGAIVTKLDEMAAAIDAVNTRVGAVEAATDRRVAEVVKTVRAIEEKVDAVVFRVDASDRKASGALSRADLAHDQLDNINDWACKVGAKQNPKMVPNGCPK